MTNFSKTVVCCHEISSEVLARLWRRCMGHLSWALPGFISYRTDKSRYSLVNPLHNTVLVVSYLVIKRFEVTNEASTMNAISQKTCVFVFSHVPAGTARKNRFLYIYTTGTSMFKTTESKSSPDSCHSNIYAQLLRLNLNKLNWYVAINIFFQTNVSEKFIQISILW